MNIEEIYNYLNDHAPEGVDFTYPDDRNYWCANYKGEGAWTYIPQDITIEELDKSIKECAEYFDIEMVPPVDGVNVV